ncbi:GNAT family acetyltransferase, partial [Aspergillus sclerotialis]
MTSNTSNFYFPIRELSSNKVKLTPFDPTKHAKPYFNGSANHPELYKYMSTGPYRTEEHFVTEYLTNRVSKDPSMACFAIIDKTKPGSPADPEGEVAGMVSYMSASPQHMSAEVGYIVILPPFQRTHVTTHAVGLILQYALDSPDQGGLGLRRMQWLADPPNQASMNCARRMGFQFEGILRWNRVVVDAEARGKGHNGRVGPG